MRRGRRRSRIRRRKVGHAFRRVSDVTSGRAQGSDRPHSGSRDRDHDPRRPRRGPDPLAAGSGVRADGADRGRLLVRDDHLHRHLRARDVGADLLRDGRSARRPRTSRTARRSTGTRGLEIVWTVVPAILVIAIGVVSAVVLSQNGDAGKNPMTVKVFAQQFSWRFEYPDSKGLKSYELVMPRQPQHHLRDAVRRRDPLVLDPGDGAEAGRRPRDRHEHRDHADEDGRLHARLHRALRARPRDDALAGDRGLAGRLRQVGRRSSRAAASRDADGAAVFASAGCGGCHAFTPADTNGAIGPDLDNVAADAKKAGEDPDGVRQGVDRRSEQSDRDRVRQRT